MNTSASDSQRYMEIALQLASTPIIPPHPNPRVGCVIVKDNTLVGRGYHAAAGEVHAERMALAEAGSQAKDATCYVTLEPCCHVGRTPPCTEALIQAGIKHVVIATPDPNPQVANQGIEALKNHGIRCTVGICATEARALNRGFLKRMEHQRPYVRCKLAMSLDGRTALANGQSQWITGEAARNDGHALRAQSDAIITGINSILTDNSRLTVRTMEIAKQPLRVILDSHLKMPQNAATLTEPGQTLILTGVTAPKTFGTEQTIVEQIPLNEGRLDLNAVLEKLNTLEINDVLIEAGPTLAGTFITANLIDELTIYLAPKLLGHTAKPLLNLPEKTALPDCPQLTLQSTTPLGPDLKLIYRNH